MPEISNEAALELLRVAKQAGDQAINAMNGYVRFQGRSSGVDKIAWLSDVRADALGAGVNLTDWVGNPEPRGD